MTKKYIALLTVLIILISCKSNSQDSRLLTKEKMEEAVGVQNVSSLEFQKLINSSKITLVDIRTLQEYNQGHIPNAIWVDWYKKTFQAYIQELPKDKAIAIYCRSGNRSGKATHVLQSLGFKSIYNLHHGINDWNAKQLALTRKDSKKNIAFQEKLNTTSQNTNSKNTGKVYNVSAVDFKKLVDLKKVLLIDIRTTQEYKSGYIEGALNIDWYKRDFKDKIKDFSKEKPIAIYCRSGNRTGKAVALLQTLGFKQIVNLARGINDWNKNAFPLVQ